MTATFAFLASLLPALRKQPEPDEFDDAIFDALTDNDFSPAPQEPVEERELRLAKEARTEHLERAKRFSEAKDKAVDGERRERLAAEARSAQIAILEQKPERKWWRA